LTHACCFDVFARTLCLSRGGRLNAAHFSSIKSKRFPTKKVMSTPPNSPQCLLKNHPYHRCLTDKTNCRWYTSPIRSVKSDEGLEGREFSGCSPSPIMTSAPTSPQCVTGSKGSLSLGSEDTSTGKSSLDASLSPLSLPSKTLSEHLAIVNSQEVMQPPTMFGKKTLGLQERNLNLGLSRSNAIRRPTGKLSGRLQSLGNLKRSRRTLELCLTILSSVSQPITSNLLQWFEQSKSIGELQVQVNLIEPGQKPAQKLMLKIHDPSFGAVTDLRHRLSSMNLEAELMSPICSVGLIAIQSEWRSKALQDLWLYPSSGSPRMSVQATGSPIWTT